eukprot:3242348-Amphidinium_carterae.1
MGVVMAGSAVSRCHTVVRSVAKKQGGEATPLNRIESGQRCVVKGTISFMSMLHTTQTGSPEQVVELHDASTLSTDPVRVTVMGQHNMQLLEEASFGACIQLDAPLCSEYLGVLSHRVGPKDTGQVRCRSYGSMPVRRVSLLRVPGFGKMDLSTGFFFIWGWLVARKDDLSFNVPQGSPLRFQKGYVLFGYVSIWPKLEICT